MMACVLESIGHLEYKEVEMPIPKDGQVLIKIMASGICGSDISRVLTKGTYHFPTIPGHEFSGKVVDITKGVSSELLGRKTAIFPLIPCRQCEPCQIGEYAQCKNYNYFGSRCDGGFAEYIAVPTWNLVLAPDSLTYQEIAMAEPSAVAIHTLRQAGVEISDDVVIFGAGPIGIMLGQWARAWGADKIILVDIDAAKIDFAKSQGFDLAFNSSCGDIIEYVYDLTDGKGADLAVEGAGVSITLEQCLYVLRPFGRVVAMGNPVGEMKLSQKAYWELLRKQLTLKGTWNSSYVSIPKNDWKLSIRAMETSKINVKSLVTHQVKLQDCIKPFRMMEKRDEFFNKVMFVTGDD